MEFAKVGQDKDGMFGSWTLSDISIASCGSSKGQHNSAGSGNMSFDATAKHIQSRRVKVMCSVGGNILPRPADKKLRYVGGETRMISVPRHIHYDAFIDKMAEIYGDDFAFKYQLPDEDLDALVSVSNDEDLENMMEECDRLEAMNGACRLRVFIFGASDRETRDLISAIDPKVADRQYVEAVNAVVAEGVSRKHDDIVLAAPSRDSGELETYTWNAIQPESPVMGTPVPTSHYLASRTFLQAFDSHLMLSHPAATRQTRCPVEFVKANQGANTNNCNDFAVPMQGLLDLEYGGSTSSSTTSQPDHENQHLNHLWTSNPQTQLGPESAWCNIDGEYYTSKTETSLAMEIGGKTTDTLSFPAKTTSMMSPATVTETPSMSSEKDMTLMSDFTLQNTHFKCNERDILPRTFAVAAQQPSSVPFSPLNPLPLDSSYPQSMTPCTQDGSLGSRITEDSIFLDISHTGPPISTAVGSSLNGRGIAFADSLQQVWMPSGAFPEQLSHNADIREASWFAPQQSTYPSMAQAKSPSSCALQPLFFEEFTFPPAQAQESIFSAPLLAGEPPTVSSTQVTQVASKIENLPVDFLLDLHNVPDEVSRMENNAPPTSPSASAVANGYSDNFPDPFFSKESRSARCQEVVQPCMGTPTEYEKTAVVIVGDDLSASVTTEGTLEIPLPKSTAVTTYAIASQETMHGHLEVRKSLRDEDMDLGVSDGVEIFQSSKIIPEELDKTEAIEEQPINAAAAAEAEAIALGLQIIRNCDLEELRELGSGTFGTVYHGKWRGTDVAIKRIESSVFTGRPVERDRLIADFWREACLLGQLHHPNVVAFYGVVPDGPGGTLATVTEFMVNGSLKQALLKNERALDRRKRLLIAMDAAFGMEYLHGRNVIHFDMKCENLLVNLRDAHRPICKVGDLGLSKIKQQTMVSGSVRGTLPWMAPELLSGNSTLVSEKVDVYSFGIVLWELLTGEEPYADMHYGAIIGGIVSNTLRPPIPRWCDPAWRSLMERCWSANPLERPAFAEIAGSLRAMEASLRQATPAISTS